MSDIKVFRNSFSQPEEVPATAAIADAPPDSRGPASASGQYGDTLTGNRGNNGRSPFPLPQASVLEQRWVHEFELFGIKGLAAAGNRVFVDGQMRWVLLDAQDGRSRAGDLRGLGAPYLDAENQLLVRPDGNGQLKALHFDRGQPVFWSSLYLNQNAERTFAAPVGDSLMLIGQERQQVGSDNPHVPKWTIVEALPLFPQPEIRESRQLQPGLIDPLLFESLDAKPVAWGGGMALVFQRRIYFLDDRLNVMSVLSGAFAPIAVSADEKGVLHLLVDEPGNKRALWIVGEDGGRTLRFFLPAPFEKTTAPPLIAFNRDIIFRGPTGLLCISPNGAIRWSRPISPGGGALIAGDGKLLANDGNALVSFDRDGQRQVLHSFAEPLVGAPMLQEGGVITVASENRVFCLQPHPRAR